MRSIYRFVLSVVAAVATVSCVSELGGDYVEDVPAGKKVKMTFSASFGEDTKAKLMYGREVWWEQGNMILINGDPFYAKESGNRVDFVGETEPAAEYYAIYPEANSSEWENGTYTFTLQASSYVLPENFFFQSAAKCQNGENVLHFTHLLGYVKLTVPEELGYLTHVEVYANGGENIAATRVKVDYSGDRPSLKAAEERVVNVKDLGFGGPGDYYIPLYPGTYSKGLTFSFYRKDGLVANKSINQEITLEPGVVQNIGVIKDLPEFGYPTMGIRGALIRLYKATGGDKWINNDGWCSAEPVGNWYGVSLSGSEYAPEMLYLYLDQNNLKGSITSDVFAGVQCPMIIWLLYNPLTKIEIIDNVGLEQLYCIGSGLQSLDVRGAVNLSELDCSKCHLSQLNVDGCINLVNLYCFENVLTDLDISTCAKLDNLQCSDNHFETFDLTQCPSIVTFSCYSNNPNYGLKSINVSGLQNLKNLACGGSFLKEIDVSTNPNLEDFGVNADFLTSVDISNNPKLKKFTAHRKFAESEFPEGSPRITEIDISHNPELEVFAIASKGITHLDFSHNPKLREVSFTACDLESVDVSCLPLLERLECNNNRLTSLDLSSNPKLNSLACLMNSISELDFSKNPELRTIRCSENLLTELDVSVCPYLEYLQTLSNPDLEEIYVLSSQNFNYDKDDWTEFVFKDGGSWGGGEEPDDPENPSFYESTDYSQDGVVNTLQVATKGNGIDIVLMGDGYSDRLVADGTYAQVMKRAMDHFFTEEPYKSFKDHFNVYYVTAVSKNEVFAEGASTSFGCDFGDGTMVYGDLDKVIEYTKKALDESRMDESVVIVLLNSDKYAGACDMYVSEHIVGDYGSGMTVSFCPTAGDEATFAQIVHHEAAGHGFAKLGDEYSNIFAGAIPDYQVEVLQYWEAYGWNKNVDVIADPTQIKWAHFLADSRYSEEGLGVYEGSYTYEYEVYRPSWESIMNHNIGGFNAPSREAIFYRIHKLAYGTQWEYDYEEFVEYDARNRTTATKAGVRNYVEKAFVPLAPPVIIKGDWRDQ